MEDVEFHLPGVWFHHSFPIKKAPQPQGYEAFPLFFAVPISYRHPDCKAVFFGCHLEVSWTIFRTVFGTSTGNNMLQTGLAQ
jgi:hypothetical protein